MVCAARSFFDRIEVAADPGVFPPLRSESTRKQHSEEAGASILNRSNHLGALISK